MIYITGDTHGSYSKIVDFSSLNNLGPMDIIIILGDTGLNYYGDERDTKKKAKVSKKIFAKLAFVHGNHDIRPENIATYQQLTWYGGVVYQEKDFPNLIFLKDGEIYNFDGNKTIVAGGAYSIDKDYRLAKGYNWFADEQPSPKIKYKVEQALSENKWTVDRVLTHTCPLKYVPQEALFASVDQTKVDKSTEQWLDNIENKLNYNLWFCGHYHIDKCIDKIRFLFNDIIPY